MADVRTRVRRRLRRLRASLPTKVRTAPEQGTPESSEPIRPVVPAPRRRAFLEERLPVADLAVLEVGAFDQPTYGRDEIDIQYFDRFSPSELGAKYGHVESRTIESAVEPDYVSKDKRFAAAIDRRFDLVIANHVLEHAADPLTWLDQLAEVTRPGGSLFMALPDRRYTFDILRRDSPLTDWLRWRDQDLTGPSADQLFDAIYYHRAIRHMDVWKNEAAAKLDTKRFEADDAWRRAQYHATEDAVDSHCSVFTWESFSSLWQEVEELGSRWRWADGQDVVPGSNEFFVLLSRCPSSPAQSD